jgi:hypothetical protein
MSSHEDDPSIQSEETEVEGTTEAGAPPTATKKPAKKFKFRGKYPAGGPKIIRAELEKFGLVYSPPSTPDGSWTRSASPFFDVLRFPVRSPILISVPPIVMQPCVILFGQ